MDLAQGAAILRCRSRRGAGAKACAVERDEGDRGGRLAARAAGCSDEVVVWALALRDHYQAAAVEAQGFAVLAVRLDLAEAGIVKPAP